MKLLIKQIIRPMNDYKKYFGWDSTKVLCEYCPKRAIKAISPRLEVSDNHSFRCFNHLVTKNETIN